jgi:hypothetical protein
MPIKLGKSVTVKNRQTGKLETQHNYIHIVDKKELIDKYNNSNTRKRDKQKIKNELIKRGGVVFG